jgi:hypothetical protein
MDASSLAKLKRLRDDFTYFAPRVLKILDKSNQIIPFTLNQAQIHAHEKLEQQLNSLGRVRALILKGRQQGLSTYVEGRFYHKTSMGRPGADGLVSGKSSYILTHQDKSTQAIFGMVNRYYDNSPRALRPVTSAANANELVFPLLNSRYGVGTAGSQSVGRGLTAQLFHGSEFAFWNKAKEHLAGIGQAIGDIDGTEIILESTANGINEFYFKVQDAMRGKGDYILIFIPWYWEPTYRREVPDSFVMDAEEADYAERYDLDVYQIAWRRNKIETDFGGDASWFDQEYPATIAMAFRRANSSSYIPLELVEDAMKPQTIEISGNMPKIMGVDPAEYGDDDTAITLRQGRVVPWIRSWSKKGTMEVVGITARIADEEKPDAINVDCTGIGSGVADRLLELGYPVNRVHFGESAYMNDIYSRRKDEMYGEMKKWLEDSPCSIPNDEALKADMTVAGYTYDSSRRLVLESKEKIKARGLPSPDRSDALALTFAVGIAPKQTTKTERRPFNWRAGY